jgi:hypothetical protein
MSVINDTALVKRKKISGSKGDRESSQGNDINRKANTLVHSQG